MHLLSGVELMKFVKSITRSVKVKSKERQDPAQYDSISEDFVFTEFINAIRFVSF